ncbi:hypothetical protein BAE44_0006897 [Dichanthelium oligosanthes]|uniref:Uncharacterized protein n=1 Tax=Dichanthelium oligosanthes TaxID=888268 RepID=A0A1E5W3X4_9POAL|nr:hypothetical protein BAE44_0006897 [Dichanthelium oligosanthes]
MAPSSSSSSAGSALGGSHAGLAIAATAMALSGTLVLFSLCRAKQPQLVPSSSSADAGAPSPRLRPCLSSSEKRKKREKARRGGKKRVRFADDVVDNGRLTRCSTSSSRVPPAAPSREAEPSAEPSCAAAAMPANREALYRGMLRGRSMLRVSCSY